MQIVTMLVNNPQVYHHHKRQVTMWSSLEGIYSKNKHICVSNETFTKINGESWRMMRLVMMQCLLVLKELQYWHTVPLMVKKLQTSYWHADIKQASYQEYKFMLKCWWNLTNNTIYSSGTGANFPQLQYASIVIAK